MTCRISGWLRYSAGLPSTAVGTGRRRVWRQVPFTHLVLQVLLLYNKLGCSCLWYFSESAFCFVTCTTRRRSEQRVEVVVVPEGGVKHGAVYVPVAFWLCLTANLCAREKHKCRVPHDARGVFRLAPPCVCGSPLRHVGCGFYGHPINKLQADAATPTQCPRHSRRRPALCASTMGVRAAAAIDPLSGKSRSLRPGASRHGSRH